MTDTYTTCERCGNHVTITAHMGTFHTGYKGRPMDRGHSPLVASRAALAREREAQAAEWDRLEYALDVDPQAARDERDYQAGLADGARRSAERAIYGDALADRFAIVDEHARYDVGDE